MESTAQPRAHTLRAQKLVNGIVRILLRTPLLCRVVGRRLVVVRVIGRTSGRRYDVPVAYVRTGGALLIGTPFAWVRNMRTGTAVDVVLAGRLRPAAVEVIADEDGVVAAYATMCRANPAFARFNAITLDPHGEPDPDELHAAWRSGARAVRLTPLAPLAG